MTASYFRRRSTDKGAALIIVLALLVLLMGVTLTFFSRTTSERQLAHSSYNDTSADLLARTAVDTIISDLRQEIISGSASPAPTFGPTTSPGPFHLYLPKDTGSGPTANMVPQRSGNLAAAPNLIRRSVRSDPMPTPGIGSRASAVNSTTDLSANGRSVTPARWNSHYLIPKQNTGTDDSIPINAFANATPDWVFVTDQGPTIITQPMINMPTSSFVGRYAYAVYTEGGLLDMNVAGYPTGTTIYQYGRKGNLAFADLTAPSPFPIPNGSGGSAYQVDKLVGWRNYATTRPSNLFPTSSFALNFQTDPTRAAAYFTWITGNTNGFLSPSTATWNTPPQTDQLFVQRQELLALQSTTGFSSNALQYLSTFSREGAVQPAPRPTPAFYGAAAGTPQWSPVTPTSANPNFQTLFVTQSFTRNDGTTANVGDYLVNRRFLLQRLDWLTYRGPSATRTIPGSAPPIGDPNYDMWLLTGSNSTVSGLPSTFLQQGTDLSQPGQNANTANIYKYFGLVWDSTNERWNYIGHPATPSATSLPATSIATFGPGGTNDPAAVPTTRELDFFELLQAGIDNTSLGDFFSSDPALPSVHQASKMLHILAIGANLIAQSRVDSYPVRIACSVDIGGGTFNTMEAVGAPRLPYLNSLAVCPVAGTATSGSATGGVNWLLVPNLWDPFRDSWDLTEAGASNGGNGPNLTPGYVRPPVRITVSGSVGLGAVLAGSSVRTGIVSAALVTPSPSPTAVLTISPAQSLALTSPTASPAMGSNGFLEASTMSTSDVTPAPPAFTPATSVSPTPVGQWVNVPYPSPVGTPAPAGNNLVFAVSFPGSNIPDSWTSPPQNPVLVLQPGFQITLDYQSPNGQWYSYSFLQGNSASPTTDPSATPHATWISGGNMANPGLNLTTTWSVYGYNPSPSPTPSATPYPTILLASPSPTAAPATMWDITALAEAPMFAKADPRSIRYNSQIGVVRITSPTPTASPFAAGVVRSIWPSGFTTPPPMTIGTTPTVTPTPTPTGTPTPTAVPNAPNPATLGDNAMAGNPANPYSETSGDGWRPVMMNRRFRSVGEMAYAFRDQPFKTLGFSSINSPDAALLDLFTVNDVSDARNPRAGVINLNSAQAWPLAAILANTVQKENTPRSGSPGAPTPVPLSSPTANSLANNLVNLIGATPLQNKADLANVIAKQATLPATSVAKTERELIARALGEVDQTRTWNLLIDVVAQSGHFKPNAISLQNDFIVEGEEHDWVHVAIDRFTGQVLERQFEVVKE